MTIAEWYDQPEHTWVADVARHEEGMEVVTNEDVQRCAYDPYERVIWLPYGLRFDQYHWVIARASIATKFPGLRLQYDDNCRCPRRSGGTTREARIIPFPSTGAG